MGAWTSMVTVEVVRTGQNLEIFEDRDTRIS